MPLLETFTNFELTLLCTVMPAVFVFLWMLILGDFKNFIGSRKAYTEYTAADPVNCYQNHTDKKDT